VDTDLSTRWVRVGHSTDPSAHAAGRAATRAALDGPPGQPPRLLVVFASFEYDLTALIAGVSGVAADAGGVPVIGCSTAGEIGPGPAVGTGVVVLGLGGGFEVRTACATGLGEDPRRVGEEVGSALLPLPSTGHRAAIVLADALAGDQQEMIRGAFGVLGASVPLIGGGAGDNMRMVTSRQFYGDQVLRDAVVAACVGSASPLGISVQHGWTRCSAPMVVTASAGNEVHTFDDQPALDLYLERFNAPPGTDTDQARFFEYALTHPLAISRRGDDAVRHVLGADPKARSLMCAGAVPKGAAAWLMSGDVESSLAATDAACAGAIEQLGGHPLSALLVFDCAGRRALLGDEGMVAERATIERRAGGAPMAGFYTFGEIARIRGVNGFHNQTIVAVALS
jgi:hypothetical protein